MDEEALLLTDANLDNSFCKTAHGLLLGKSRYPIAGIIDQKFAGKDVHTVFSKHAKSVPIFATIPEALQQLNIKPKYCIVGLAPRGGRLSPTLEATIIDAIHERLNIVSGLHTLLNDHPHIAALAKLYQVELIDVRKPKPTADLHTWSGKLSQVTIPIVAVLGMDCAIGKRTTASLLVELCQNHHIKAEMIYTGQTGWLQGGHYGFILDATLNDFVAGELEDAMFRCINEVHPDIIFIEGQSALRNPSGPCGSELIRSAGAHYVILQVDPMQKYYHHTEIVMPDVMTEIQLIELLGAKVIGITLNSREVEEANQQAIKKMLAEKTGLPVCYPLEEGLGELLPTLQAILKK